MRLLIVEDEEALAQNLKKLLEAKLFDAATMAPVDTKDVRPEQLSYPQTPWMRDHSKSFLVEPCESTENPLKLP